MKGKTHILVLGIIVSGLAAASAADFEAEIQPLLDHYCYKCHGAGRRIRGDLNLTDFRDIASIHRHPKTWETVLRQLQEREMPPEGKPQPSDPDRERLASWIKSTLENPDENAIPKDPGRVVLHRLSRAEYNKTVRDLFGIDSRPADGFPSEGGGGGGFDNNADTLFIPPILMERYVEAAHSILDQASSEALFVVKASDQVSEKEAARRIVEHHAFRAFRRPISSEEIDRFMTLYGAAEGSGRPFEETVKTVLSALLISPHFLFRVELDQSGEGPYRITDYELATRLSYFLWSSMPDGELFRLAGEDRLHEPEVLEEQVLRMLSDPKAGAFAEQFAGQWLGVNKLDSTAQPDPRRFESYTVELRDSMKREPIEFFRFIVQENRSLLEMINASYTFLDQSLAKHYGIDGVEGGEFQKVALTNPNRGGVLGMASILTLTSYPQRTSPVLRGKWVLEEILGTPPPPPPPLVKGLPRDDRTRDGLTFRQRLEQHRKDPSCASCHRRMDPLGFGLENFDAIGQWRTEISSTPVDATGELPSGRTFTGPAELKEVLLENKDIYIRNLTERMLAYALGRGLEYYDAPVVRKIAGKLASNGYTSQTLILEIAKSFPFQYRRNQEIESL